MELFPSQLQDYGEDYLSDFGAVSPSNISTLNKEECTREQLWELLKEKEAVVLRHQKTLTHIRSWMGCIENRASQINPVLVENAKRLYVGGLPQNYQNGQELKNFLENIMTAKKACICPGSPVLSVKIQCGKNYGFLCLRSVEETTRLLVFDGILFKGNHLKIRRPSNYDAEGAIMLGPPTPDPTLDSTDLNVCKSIVQDSPKKLFVGGIPGDWTEQQVKQMLAQLGNLRALNLIMDKVTGNSKGYAFCEFFEQETDFVIATLNQRKIGNKVLTVKRALEQPNIIQQQIASQAPPLTPEQVSPLTPILPPQNFLTANPPPPLIPQPIQLEDVIPTSCSLSLTSSNGGGLNITPNSSIGPVQQRRNSPVQSQQGNTSCTVEDVLCVFKQIRNRFGLEVADILADIQK